MKKVYTIEEMLRALPEDVTIGDILANNLAALQLALEGMCIIIDSTSAISKIDGNEGNIVVTVNTELGSRIFMERVARGLQNKIGK